jgi:putative membrane-bound dehydrogenase-like protein
MKNTFTRVIAVIISIISFTFVASAADSGSRSGPEAAREQLKSMKTPDGLAVTLFASEPQLVNPANMDIDSRGRVWITEGANYRRWSKLRPEGDRIVILEDTNGDGAADVVKTFYQGPDVNTALGICVLGSKVIVSSSPKIMVFTDANGDDKADGPPQVLFSGIAGVQHDHGAHAFVFGPDGKLYFNLGNDGRQLKTSDGAKFIVDANGNEVNANGKPYRQGLVFRCNLDGSEVETLGWNFRNNYEVTVDSFGTIWQSDNDDDGNRGVRINFVMEFGNYGYTDEMTGAGWGQKRSNMETEIPQRHWHLNDPGVVPNLLLTGAGSPTGITIYEGNLLPAVFQNQIIHCDAGPRVVRAYPVELDGAGYKAKMVDLLTSTDSWYRPSDVAVAPDGSIYIADWNDAGVGGHNMADQKLETMTGRIYRVAPPGHKASVPKINLSTAAGCVEALQSPNYATRYLAWTKLHEMQGQAESELGKLWKSDNQRFRARALHLLARIKGSEPRYVEQALKDGNADIRVTGLRIARELKLDVVPYIRMLAYDASPQVRRECAIALRHHKAPEAPRLWAHLAQQHDGQDRWYLEALGIGADKQWDQYFDAWMVQVRANWNTPAGRDLLWRSRSKKTPSLLVKIINDKETPEQDRARYFRSLDFIQGPEKDAALLELLSSK